MATVGALPPSTRPTRPPDVPHPAPCSGSLLGIEIADPPPDDRPARGRPRLLRRRRPAQRGAAALRAAGDDRTSAEFYRYPPLLAIAFRPLALLPFETAAADLGGVLIVASRPDVPPARRRRRETGSCRACSRCRPSGPRHRPGPGRRDAAAGVRHAVGVALAANLKVFPACSRSIGSAGATGSRSAASPAGWSSSSASSSSSSRQATLDFLARSGSTRSVMSRTSRSTPLHRSCGRSRSSPASGRVAAWRRRAGAGRRRSRCRCSRRRGC